jgi:hypothetical protein
MSLEYMSLWSLQPINFSVSYCLGVTIHLMRRNVVQHGVALQGIPDPMEIELSSATQSSCQAQLCRDAPDTNHKATDEDGKCPAILTNLEKYFTHLHPTVMYVLSNFCTSIF